MIVGFMMEKSNPFPKSIYENVVYPLRVAGKNDSKLLDETVERSLRASALWDEVKDGLEKSALELSGARHSAFVLRGRLRISRRSS